MRPALQWTVGFAVALLGAGCTDADPPVAPEAVVEPQEDVAQATSVTPPPQPDEPSVQTAATTSTDWTVISHLEPSGVMDVRFTVAEPTTCRLAMFWHQPTGSGSRRDLEGHVDAWIDGESLSPLYGVSGYSNWDDRVKAGAVDTRAAYDAALGVYGDTVYGEGATFASGVGLRDVDVRASGRLVLGAMGELVDAPEAVNFAIGGSLLASIECGSTVTLEVYEDAQAIWSSAAQLGGDAAVQTLGGGAEAGALDFVGDGAAIEAIVGSWGGVQGTMTLRGAIEAGVTFQGVPEEVQPDQTFSGPPGNVHVEWTTARANGNWWIGLASWGQHAATITPGGTYPF